MGKFRLRGRWRRNRGPRRGSVPIRAVIPNLVTSLAACCGIASIALSSEGRFSGALVALLIAAVCDGMDGRIARMLKASSKLGAELDSLADFVNFGVAPALFMYFWVTGKCFGAGTAAVGNPAVVRAILACSLFYAMCDCFRLARFNTMLEQEPLPYWKNYFTGIPAPGGCWMVLTPAILVVCCGEWLEALRVPAAVTAFLRSPACGMFMLLSVGALMASRLPTVSLKAIHLHGKRQVQLFMIVALLLVVGLVCDTWLTLGALGILYFLTVPLTGVRFLRARAKYARENAAANGNRHLTSSPNKG